MYSNHELECLEVFLMGGARLFMLFAFYNKYAYN